MYSRILVAVDGSVASNRALIQAIELLGQYPDAKMKLVHVIEQAPESWQDSKWTAGETAREHALREAGKQVMEQAMQPVRTAGIAAENEIIEKISSEKYADVVVKEAQRWAADLIVIGTHGRRGIRHLMLGSVAEGVIRAADLPVLVVPARGRDEEAPPQEP